jgi:hypothetical protein
MVQVICFMLPFFATILFHHLYDKKKGLLMRIGELVVVDE